MHRKRRKSGRPRRTSKQVDGAVKSRKLQEEKYILARGKLRHDAGNGARCKTPTIYTV